MLAIAGLLYLVTLLLVGLIGAQLAYAAGQLAALLPFMPGGLGVVGSMSAVLAAYGGTTTARPAELLYRLIGYWTVLLTGAICYLSLWRRRSLVTPAETGAGTDKDSGGSVRNRRVADVTRAGPGSEAYAASSAWRRLP